MTGPVREEDMTPEEWEAHCERMKARYRAAASNLLMFLDEGPDREPMEGSLLDSDDR